VTRSPLAEVLAQRVFELTSMHQPQPDGSLNLYDAPGGWYSAPPALPDGSSGLVSTIDDLYAFATMLASNGGGLLSAESVRLMLRDRTTARDKAEHPMFFGGNSGWGSTAARCRRW
jgi:CubicO group peptidase (beta-lactamase class C family)